MMVIYTIGSNSTIMPQQWRLVCVRVSLALLVLPLAPAIGTALRAQPHREHDDRRKAQDTAATAARRLDQQMSRSSRHHVQCPVVLTMHSNDPRKIEQSLSHHKAWVEGEFEESLSVGTMDKLVQERTRKEADLNNKQDHSLKYLLRTIPSGGKFVS
jgi:hypothetical protein